MSFYADENARYEIGIKICEFDYQEKGLGQIALSMLIEGKRLKFSRLAV